MALKTSIATKAASLNGALGLLNNGSKVKVYAGAAPTETSDAITTQILLSTHDMAAVPFATTATATATANAIASATAGATGTASFYRIENAEGVVHRQGAVGVGGSGSEMIIDNTSVVTGGTVNITSYQITQG